jgi:hypothetical protein
MSVLRIPLNLDQRLNLYTFFLSFFFPITNGGILGKFNIKVFFLISQYLYQKAQRGATLSTLGVYKRD